MLDSVEFKCGYYKIIEYTAHGDTIKWCRHFC
jgi:hypothetical protein